MLALAAGALLAPAAAAEDPGLNDFLFALTRLVPEETYRNNGLTVFPILALPFGGEQVSMGNAYTAVARDISFLAANPAAGALQDKSQLAAFHAVVGAGGTLSLDTLGWSDRWGDASAGAFIKLLSSEFTAVDSFGRQQASGAYAELVGGLNGSVSLFRDYNFSGLAVGLNLKVAYRHISKEFYQQITRLAGTDQGTVGVLGDFGLLTRFNFLKAYSSRDKNFSVGLVLKDIGFEQLGEPLPTTLSAGLSWQPLRPWTIAGDFNLPINLVDPASSPTPGFAVGTSVQIANFAGVQAGFQFKGGNPRVTVGVHVAPFDWSELSVAYTYDFSTTFRLPDHISMQLRLNFSDNGRAEQARKVDELYVSALVASAGAQWATVITLCEEALRLDAGFIPARDLLQQARVSQSLIKQIESIRVEDRLPE